GGVSRCARRSPTSPPRGGRSAPFCVEMVPSIIPVRVAVSWAPRRAEPHATMMRRRAARSTTNHGRIEIWWMDNDPLLAREAGDAMAILPDFLTYESFMALL